MTWWVAMSRKYRESIESVAASDSGTNVSPVSENISVEPSGGSDGRAFPVARTRVSSLSSVYSSEPERLEGPALETGLALEAGALAGARSLDCLAPLADWVRRLIEDSGAKPFCKI